MGEVSVGSRGVRLGVSRIVGVAIVFGLMLSLAPAAVGADLAEFGKPTGESTFAGGVDFRQSVTIDRPLSRVELLLTIGDAIGPVVIPVAGARGTGSSTLSYHFDPAADGHLYPGTRLVAQWRLVSADDATDVSVGPKLGLAYADDRFEWRTAAGDLVRVHWYEGSASFGASALRIGEDAVRTVAELLGVTESNPIDLYVYADKAAFHDALGPRTGENVSGAHVPGTRLMFALIPPGMIGDSEVRRIVPHELTHLVFETAAGNPYHFPPLWLNEGVAVYLSQGYDTSDRARVEEGTRAGTLIPLDGLVGQFPTNTDGFYLAYAESVSAVEYLVRIHGRDPLVSLIRSYAAGRTDDEAFSAALGVNMSAFGAAWLQDLGAVAPTRYGPQSAPRGPIPSAWLAELNTSLPPAASGEPKLRPQASPAPTDGSLPADGVPFPLVLPIGGVAALLIGVGLVARRRAKAAGGPG